MAGIEWLLSLLTIISVLVAACVPMIPPASGAIVGDLAGLVDIERISQRIVSLVSSNTEVLFALGYEEKW